MKSEHRHELAENDLAKLLNKWGAELDKRINVILSVLIVAALLGAGYLWWSRTSVATNAAGWTELTAARTAEEFVTVAETFPETPVADWATLRAAQGFLEEGIRLSLTDRPASKERLQQALDSYDSLLNDSSVAPEIREQALMGNALTLETMSDGDTSDAIAAYEALISQFPSSRFKDYAEDRIQTLKTGGAQDFYAWFHKLNPKPAPRPDPQDQSDPFNPSASEDILDLSNSSLPEGRLPLTSPGAGDEAPLDTDFNPFEKQEMEKTPATGIPETTSPEKTTPDTTADSPSTNEAKPDAAQDSEKQTPEGSNESAPEAKPESKPEETTSETSQPTEVPTGEPDTPSQQDSPAESP